MKHDCMDYIKEIKENIILIGMPGCGKTSVGKNLSLQSGKEHVDIDEEIEKDQNLTISEIFKHHSEEYFRDIESKIIKRECRRSKLIISSGGGAVIRPENVLAMKENGIIVWIKRDIAKLDTRNRPLSENPDALKKIYRDRWEIYNNICDLEIDNTKSVIETSVLTSDGIIEYIKGKYKFENNIKLKE